MPELAGASPVLVTGATGFVGTAVVRELLRRHDGGALIRVLCRREPPAWMREAGIAVVHGDLAEAATLDGACDGVSTVLHLASRIGGDLEACTAVNVDGTRALLEQARRAGVSRVVQLSTTGVYGDGVHRGASESLLAPSPVSVTSRTRLAAERMTRAAGGIVLRPHLVYGEGDKWVVPTVLRWLRAVPGWADGGVARSSMVAVSDLASVIAALACMRWGPRRGAVFHVNHPRPVSMRELVTALCGHLDLPLPDLDLTADAHRMLTRSALPSLTDHQFSMLAQDHFYDSTRIWSFTGVEPGPGLATRLPDAIPWYRDVLSGKATAAV
ncbi:nucleoside-diphosphate-sugar epimerase [Herbihabitans rhizosphaerae]|uniref:Nucleoside-diphosphate-sugar epimerase n=1 Tax=Herbihabitans rhizosphaerae TaxID=1872711 RepID=A0A4Q7KL10_9PSEU|nr:NAD-dependent epimerase/dehydratase family protein [Herbihabitans rhizosphaerae]RZS36580.1 nucleoside-diphosphate-sugar epimerase [Herbihabitans rhizosphaerae]